MTMHHISVIFAFVKITLVILQSDAQIFDDYAGPYIMKSLVLTYCPSQEFSCGNFSWSRQRIPGIDEDWLLNATFFFPIYVTDDFKVQVIVSTRGMNGRYNSLIDSTQPACYWMEYFDGPVTDAIQHAGYKKGCASLLPGVYSIIKFRLRQKKHLKFDKVLPFLPYGIYKADFRFSIKGHPNWLCLRFHVNISPDTREILRRQKTQEAASAHGRNSSS